jgi:hypothetical protein
VLAVVEQHSACDRLPGLEPCDEIGGVAAGFANIRRGHLMSIPMAQSAFRR